MTQLNILNTALSFAALRLPFAPDGDLDQLSTGTGPNVHAAGCDKFSLVARVAAEDPENRNHVRIVHHFLAARKQSGNVTAREPGLAHNISLLEVVLLSKAFQGCAEVAHNFFVERVPYYGKSNLMQ